MQRQLKTLLAGTILAIALAAATFAGGCSLLPFRTGLSGVIGPSIVPVSAQRGTRTAGVGFAFEDERVQLHVPIDSAVYAGSVAAPKTALLLGDARTSNWVPEYYRAFIAEKHQEQFYSAMLDALHKVRREQGLDSARYVELVTSMVQSLEYRVDTGNLAPKFPIQTFGDGYGDCDDKALLAAALLSRDGYDVAILLFGPEKHVALGIRAPGLEYKTTGYAFVEVTDPALVGVPTEQLAGGVKLTSRAEVVRIGKGTRTYDASAEIQYIQRRLTEVRAAQARLKSEIERANAQVEAEQAALEAERQRLQGIADQQALAGAVQTFNQRVAAANERAAQVNALVARYNALVDADRFVAEHPYARPQDYERLRSLQL